MKNCTRSLLLVLFFLSFVASVDGQEPKLNAPANWRTEKVTLPPPFAPKVKLKGKAQVYFSPGWSKTKSDQFFTYTFLFETKAEPKFDKKVIETELLAYFGGLASAVSRGKIDPATFKMNVKAVKNATKPEAENEAEAEPDPKSNSKSTSSKNFQAELKWTEPFFTKSEQTLHMEIVARFDAAKNKNYLIVGVSPQDPKSRTKASSKVWQQLRKIRGEESDADKPAATPEKKSDEPNT